MPFARLKARGPSRTKSGLRSFSFFACVLWMTLQASGLLWAQTAPPAAPVISAVDGVPIQPSGMTHDFTGLPITADGWTDLYTIIQSPGYADARIVYVSNSGNDSTAQVYGRDHAVLGNNPLNPTGSVAAFSSISAAFTRLRSGYPDVMLLRRGDSWSGIRLSVNKAGRNNSERLIIAAYGPESAPRPRLREVITENDARHVVLSSIHNGAGGGTRDAFYHGENVLIEDFLWEASPGSSATIVVNILNYGSGTIRRSAALWVSFFAGVWQPQPANSASRFEEVTISRTPLGSGLSNVYFAERARGIQSVRNQSLLTGNAGFRQRGGGIVRENLAAGTQGITYGGGFDVQGRVIFERNVGLHSAGPHDLVAMDASLVEGNIFAAFNPGSGMPMLQLPGEYEAPSGPVHGGVRGTSVFSDNVFYSANQGQSSIGWGGALGSVFNFFNQGASFEFSGNMFVKQGGGQVLNFPSDSRVSFQGQRYFSSSSNSSWFGNLSYAQAIPSTGEAIPVSHFPDPTRDMVTYLRTLGAEPSSVAEALEWYSDGVPGRPSLAGALANRRGAWDERFTAISVINYMREGFGLDAL